MGLTVVFTLKIRDDHGLVGPHLFKLKVWTPPEKHFVKINVDGSYIPETKKGSVGFVILWGTA